jgi:hypothetical protein
MKTFLLFVTIVLTNICYSQITTPVTRSGFGVDADLRSNFFNGFIQSGNDDWYNNGTAGTGLFVIDTTGAAAIRNGYATDVAPFPKRMASFYRTMSRPAFSINNNRMWLDALFIRDYHGNDTTVFTAGSDKNGMSPENWSGGVQGIPDKNDILDMYMHVRRNGPNATDSLWMFGGLSLDNVSGNRYFDFEMYQTDIYYDRASARWYGYGPDEGHTSWQFDASGNVTRPGDIIFSAEYQSSSLTNIEARIWVHRDALNMTPAAFSWSGQFDGASSGALYGYASILPKNGGTFYTGLQCGNGEWAGPFSLILQDNSMVTNYGARQFMEFSVNLTKLGLDPVTVFGSDICGTPFNRMVVKTRASASFTAELKDFVAPIDLFLAPRVNAITDVPIYCGSMGVSEIWVQNPSSSSVYTWSTTNGNIISSATGPSITVNRPGTYIVTQRLAAGCSPYAYDTVTIVFDEGCTPLDRNLVDFRGVIENKKSTITWTTIGNDYVEYFDVERSTDGRNFKKVGKVLIQSAATTKMQYKFEDDITDVFAPVLYYRLKSRSINNALQYSRIIRLTTNTKEELVLYPNPAQNFVQLSITSDKVATASLSIITLSGQPVVVKSVNLKAGNNTFVFYEVQALPEGLYIVEIEKNGNRERQKLLLCRKTE